MHFTVPIFLAFVFKETKVSPMPDRNNSKLPFCSYLTSGGGSVCIPYICIVLDLAIKLIWSTGMQGLYARLPGGSICIEYIYSLY